MSTIQHGWYSKRTEELHHQVKAIAGRDLQLWYVAFILLAAFGAGVIALALPNLLWQRDAIPTNARMLLALVSALVLFILTFTIYVLYQSKVRYRIREEIIREMVYSERLQSFSVIDPLTQTFNCRYLEQVLPRETNRANRLGRSITFLVAKVNGWPDAVEKHGEIIADQMLVETAQFLKHTFRGSDIVVRYKAEMFLIIMPETTEEQAGFALKRMFERLDVWNLENKAPYELGLTCGMSCYSCGKDVTTVLQAAEERVDFAAKERLHSVLSRALRERRTSCTRTSAPA